MDVFEKTCNLLFRGYVPTRNKRCLMKFKDVDTLPTLEEMRKAEEFAGVLRKGVLLLDFDQAEQGLAFMRMCDDSGLKYTSIKTKRGVHFFFKGDGLKATVGATLACGLQCDIKSGDKNGYAMLKVDGQERQPLKSNASLVDLPFWARPIHTDKTLYGMKRGEGRNQALFGYIATLANQGFIKQEIALTVKIVNRYAFADSLDDAEMSTLLRDESFPKDNGKPFEKETRGRNKIDPIQLGDLMIEQLHLRLIDGQIMGWEGKVYTPTLQRMNLWLYENIGARCSRTVISEVWNYIECKLSCEDGKRTSDPRYIAFNNCVYDMVDYKTLDFDESLNCVNLIPHDYNPKAYNKECDEILNALSCEDKQIRRLLEECMGYCMYRANEMSKAFLLIGNRSNGKSTFLSMVEGLLGNHNVSNVDLGLLGERFNTAMLAGKLANIGDDISTEFCKGDTVAMFKKIVSGNRVQGEFKGLNPFTFNPYVKMIFSSNEMPRMKGSEEAVARRMVIIPFNATFDKNSPKFDPYIAHKLKNENVYEYLIQIALDGLFDVLQSKGFTESMKANEMLEEFKALNDPLAEFLQDNRLEGRSVNDCYIDYINECRLSGLIPSSRKSFTADIRRRTGLVSKSSRKGDKVFRTFAKPD